MFQIGTNHNVIFATSGYVVSPVLIKGNDATTERLNWELKRNPAVIHFGTHVIQSKTDPRRAMIALSLKPDGEFSLLTQDSISALRTNAAVVTMSGCGSGRAQEPIRLGAVAGARVGRLIRAGVCGWV